MGVPLYPYRVIHRSVLIDNWLPPSVLTVTAFNMSSLSLALSEPCRRVFACPPDALTHLRHDEVDDACT